MMTIMSTEASFNYFEKVPMSNGYNFRIMMEKVPYARFVVCRRRDLSPRPFDYESNALTKLSYPGALSSFPNVISERIIYSIQGRTLPTFTDTDDMDMELIIAFG